MCLTTPGKSPGMLARPPENLLFCVEIVRVWRIKRLAIQIRTV